MAYSKIYYDSSDAVIARPVRNQAGTGAADRYLNDTYAPDLNSRELLTRLDVIRALYMAETSPAAKKQFRKESHEIKQLIGEHRRKVYISAGFVVLAVALLIVLLQNTGLI